MKLDMTWLGIDIGGANLKIADGMGGTRAVDFPLWRESAKLSSEIRELLASMPSTSPIAVTMTGELADCFTTKAAGVAAVLDAVENAADGREVSVYLCDGRLVKPQIARSEPLLAAASNWHVLAKFATQYCDGRSGLLIDIGSTTSDLIPLDDQGPTAVGKTDPERLLSGELVYTGIQRSPVCAVIRQLSWKGKACPVAQELFSTTYDAYLMLGDLPEQPDDLGTADGRPSTKNHAHARLARTICADATLFSMMDAEQAAREICEAQIQMLVQAANQVLTIMANKPEVVILSGHGEFLGLRLVERLGLNIQTVSLSEKLGAQVSRSACAHALAVLAREGIE